MPSKYFFTINLLLRSEANIKKAVDSITADEKYFKENVQLILIDPVDSTEINEICTALNAKYPENIVFIDAVGKNPAACYNDARAFALGSYISYIDNFSSYERGTLRRAQEILKSEKIPAFCMECVTEIPGADPVVYAEDIDDGIVRLHETPEKLILHEGCWFFLAHATRNLRFDTDIRFHSEQKYLIDAMGLTYSYVYSSECTFYTTTPSEHEGERYSLRYSTDFYTRSVREFIIPMLKEYAGSFLVQSAMMYLLGIKLALNAGDSYKGILTGSKLTEFFGLCSEAFTFMEDSVILNSRLLERCGLDKEFGFAFIRMKYKNPHLLPETDVVPPKTASLIRYRTSPNRLEELNLSGEFAAHIGKVLIMRSKDISANIRTMNFGDGGVYIDAELSNASCFRDEDFAVYAIVNNAKCQVIRSEVCTDRTLFGRFFFRRYAFRIFVPFSTGKSMDTISFHFRFGRLAIRLPLTFDGIHSRLSERIRGMVVVSGDRAVSYDPKAKAIAVRRSTESLCALAESRLLSEAGKTEGFAGRLYYQRLRHTAKGLMRSDDIRRIIVFCDDRGINSNGNLLFRYFSKHGGEKTIPYFITEKNSPEQLLLSDAGYENVLEKGSAKAKAVILAADMIITCDSDSYEALGFTDADRLYLRDLAAAKIISVRDDFLSVPVPPRDNRLADNVRAVFVSSEEEKSALLSPELDFDPEMIITAGNPLLDALSDKREKLILISPGARRTFDIYDRSELHRFTESVFHKEYCALLSDPKLLEQCRRKGYRIALMMPPEAEKYDKTFPQSELVSVYSPNEQNTAHLVTNAIALVTDYSDLQYRFAYLSKTVMYFYPPGLPSNSEPQGEGITKRGFGSLYFDHDKLVAGLIKGMEDDFAEEEKYQKRKKSFFAHSDRENCARIFELLTQ